MSDTNYPRLEKQRGIVNFVVLGIMGVLAVILPVATKLVQQNQENRSSAREVEGDNPNVLPTCTGWDAGNWGACTNGKQSRSVIKTPRGCTGTPANKPSTSKSCTITCTDYIYGPWSACNSNGTQIRSVIGTTPSGCTGSPSSALYLSQSCTYVPPQVCTPRETKCESNVYKVCKTDGSAWTTTTCSSNQTCNTVNGCVDKETPTTKPICTANTQYKCDGRNLMKCNSTGSTWELTKECGIDQTCNVTTKTCDSKISTPTPTPTTPTCTDYIYGPWSACNSNGTQIRSVTGTTPSGCTGSPSSAPYLSQSCTYVPPQVCTPRETKCESNVYKVCKTDGSAWTTTTCSSNQTCNTVNGCVTTKPETIPVSKITLSNTSLTLEIGKPQKLSAIISPTNATNKQVSWSTNDASTVIVYSDGTVKGLKPGSAIITVSAKDGSNTKATIKVNIAQNEITITQQKTPTIPIKNCKDNGGKCISVTEIASCKSNNGTILDKTTECSGSTPVCCVGKTKNIPSSTSEICTPGQKICANNLGLKECNSVGNDWKLTSCLWGCDYTKNECKPAPANVCIPSTQYKCDGRNLMKCNSTGSAWILSKECGIDQACNATTKSCQSPNTTDSCCGVANGKTFGSLSSLTLNELCKSGKNSILSGNITNTDTGWKWACKTTDFNQCFTNNCSATNSNSCKIQKGNCLSLGECKADSGSSLGKLDCDGDGSVCCKLPPPIDTSCTDQKGICISKAQAEYCDVDIQIIKSTECSNERPICCQTNSLVYMFDGRSQCNPNNNDNDKYNPGCKKYQTCRADYKIEPNYFRCFSDGVCGYAADSNRYFPIDTPPTGNRALCLLGTPTEIKINENRKIFYWYCVGDNIDDKDHLCVANTTESLGLNNNQSNNAEKLSLINQVYSRLLGTKEEEKLISIINQYDFNNPEEIVAAKAYINLYLDQWNKDYSYSYIKNQFYVPKSISVRTLYGSQSPFILEHDIPDPENMIPRLENILNNSNGKTVDQVIQEVIDTLTTHSSSFKEVIWRDFSQPETDTTYETSDGKYIIYNPTLLNGETNFDGALIFAYPKQNESVDSSTKAYVSFVSTDLKSKYEALITILHEYGHYVENMYIYPQYIDDQFYDGDITATEYMSSLYGVKIGLLTEITKEFDDISDFSFQKRIEKNLGFNNWVLYGTVAP